MAMAMKSMKSAVKSMKTKKKAVSKIARGKRARSSVFKGKKEKTVSGLTKTDLMLNKRGKVVSKKAHTLGLRQYKRISGWIDAVMQARKELKITGHCYINGKSAQGKALYVKAKSIYASA